MGAACVTNARVLPPPGVLSVLGATSCVFQIAPCGVTGSQAPDVSVASLTTLQSSVLPSTFSLSSDSLVLNTNVLYVADGALGGSKKTWPFDKPTLR